MKKRAQTDIITTILLILIALVALTIISIFIINQIRDSVHESNLKTEFSQVDISVEEASAGNNYLLLKRNSDNPNVKIKDIGVVINGERVYSSVNSVSDWQVFETRTVNLNDYNLKKDDKIEIYIIPEEDIEISPVLVAQSNVATESTTNLASSPSSPTTQMVLIPGGIL